MFGVALTTPGLAFSVRIAAPTLLPAGTLTTRVRVPSSPAAEACALADRTTTSSGRYWASAGPATGTSSAAATAGNASAKQQDGEQGRAKRHLAGSWTGDRRGCPSRCRT